MADPRPATSSGVDPRYLAQAIQGSPDTLSAYQPTIRERMAAAIQGDDRTGWRQWLAQSLIGGSGARQTGLLDSTPLNVLFGDEAARKMGAPGHRLAGLLELGAMALPPGAKVAGDGLAMDAASRLARAKAMGFNTDAPVYHGTASDFSAFDPNEFGTATGALTAPLGVWSTRDPKLADEYAAHAASKEAGGNPTVLPLYHRSDEPRRLSLTGDESEGQVAATIADAWDNGADSVIIAQPGRQDRLVVRDPNQLRSIFAKFDPANRDSSDLLAGFGIPLAAGAAAATANSQPAPKR